MIDDSFPAALEHGIFREIFPDIFMISGAMEMASRGMTFSRNMIVIRERGLLTLVNSMRLDRYGEHALDSLGRVTNVIRLAGFHGRDDPYYKVRYGAKVYAIRGQSYVQETKPSSEPHFDADVWLEGSSELPVSGARLYLFRSSSPAEAVLLMLRDGGILVSGDSLQNWQSGDRYFNLKARVLMRLFGHMKPYSIGRIWKKLAKPAVADLQGLLDLRFEHVLPAHGDEIIGGALQKFKPAIDRAAAG